MLSWTRGFNQILIGTKKLPKKLFFHLGKIFVSYAVVAKP